MTAHVLVVDDEPDISDGIAFPVKEMGNSERTAHNMFRRILMDFYHKTLTHSWCGDND